jgi:DNA-binding GntR family transcriptional regulator
VGREGDAARSIAHSAPIGPQLVRILRERIIRADLVPGSRLSEQEIATTYALSRQPVREAFIKLAEEGLLEVRPQRGTFVRKISVGAVMDARFVREAVEADIVRIVASEPNPALVAELRRQIARQRAVADGDAAEFLRLDEDFHRSLAEAAGKSGAWAIVEEIKAQMDRVRFLSAKPLVQAKLIRQHGGIVDGIAAGDGDAAAAAMRHHLREVLTDLPAIAADRPEFFEAAAPAVERAAGATRTAPVI